MASNRDNSEGEGKTATQKIGGFRIRLLNVIMVVLTCIVAIMFLQAAQRTNETYRSLSEATTSYITCEEAASDMKAASNYLTAQVRQFVITHDVNYLDNYFTEADETCRRDAAVQVLDEYAGSSQAHNYLEESQRLSLELMGIEYRAANLVLSATNEKANKGADTLATAPLSAEDAALSNEQKLQLAMSLVFGDEYQEYVDGIEGNVAQCKASLISDIEAEQARNADELDWLLITQQALTWVLLIVAIITIVLIIVLILWPLREYIACIGKNKALPMVGARELRTLAGEYNALYEQNLKHNDDLRRRAEHDHLTGLYNRSVFERLLQAYRSEEIALLLIDADHFKDVNDSYGHDVGDKILQKLSGLLSHAFRSTDFPCRIGGDEFAVIMTEMSSTLDHVVEMKIAGVAQGMVDTSDGLPAMTLSIGVAFSDGSLDSDTIFKHADEALYRVKEAGRNGHEFYR